VKLVTHYTFSIGLIVLIASIFLYPGVRKSDDFITVIWLGYFVNLFVDRIGHRLQLTKYGEIPVRTALSHSVTTAPVWGFLVGAVSGVGVYIGSVYVRSFFSSLNGVSVPVLIGFGVWSGAMGVIVAYSHLFADSLTMAGIFVRGHRWALAHLRYDNPLLNIGFIGLGVLMFYIGLNSVLPLIPGVI
jgi:hypothetical protein